MSSKAISLLKTIGTVVSVLMICASFFIAGARIVATGTRLIDKMDSFETTVKNFQAEETKRSQTQDGILKLIELVNNRIDRQPQRRNLIRKNDNKEIQQKIEAVRAGKSIGQAPRQNVSIKPFDR